MRRLIPVSLLAFSLAIFSMPAVGFAQVLSVGAPFTVSASTMLPRAHTRVTLTPLSASLDLAAATMTILVNGSRAYRGAAAPTAVTMGGAGEPSRIEVIISVGGDTYEQTLTLIPEDILILAEPIASAPPLYPGQPSIPLEGKTRLVAVADMRRAGSQIDPTLLSYSWVVDDIAQPSASGIGRSAIIVDTPFEYRQRTVAVTVRTLDGGLAGGASYALSGAEPVVRIYERDPLLGIRFDRALPANYAIAGSEESLYGAAYSFPTSGGIPNLTWYLNGSEAQRGAAITLRPTGGGTGTASLSLVGAVGDFVRATASLSLSFGNAASTNLFGL